MSRLFAWVLVLGFQFCTIATELAAQDAGDAFEGNWYVEWNGVTEPDAPTAMRISIFRDRQVSCDGDRMQGCKFGLTLTEAPEWNVDYLDETAFVQGAGLSAGALKIDHAYGVFGHWGGEERLHPAGENALSGFWRYRDDEGQGTWRRTQPKITKVEVRNALNATEVTAVRQIGPRHIAVEMDATTPAWNAQQNFPHARPKLVFRLSGSDLWGHHTAIFPDAIGLDPDVVAGLRGPDQAFYLEFEVTIWPGFQGGRQTLLVAGQEVVVDFTLLIGALDATVALDTGGQTRASPLQVQPLGTPNPTVGHIKSAVTSTGTEQFQNLRLTLSTKLPAVLSPNPGCTSISGQSISCELTSANGQFDLDTQYFIIPYGTGQPVQQALDVQIRAEGLQNTTGQWRPLGTAESALHLLRCDRPYGDWIADIDLARFRRVVAEATAPVEALPGYRLFRGPGLDYDLDEDPTHLAYRVRRLTRTLALRKGLNASLDEGGYAFQQLGFAERTLIALADTDNCVSAQIQAGAGAAFRAYGLALRRERAEVQNLYLNIVGNVELGEARTQAYLRGASGQLPETARLLLGVGGTNDTGAGATALSSVANGMASSRMLDALATVVNLGYAHHANLSLDAVAMDTAPANGVTRFTGVAALVLSSAQIGISLIDAGKLTEGYLNLDDVTSWVEAEAYVRGLLARYDALDAEMDRIQNVLDNISTVTPCTCGN